MHLRWLRRAPSGSPRRAAARSGPHALPAPGDGEVLVRAVLSADQPRHRSAGLRRPRAAKPISRHALPVPGWRFPGAGQIWLCLGRHRRGRPVRAGRPARLLPPSASGPLCRAGGGACCRCPTPCPTRARRWPPTWRPRSTACGTARRVSGDRIAVVGAGVVGCLVAALAAKLPGARVVLIDIDPARAALATPLGCAFALPGEAARRVRSGLSCERRGRRARDGASPRRLRGDRGRDELVWRAAPSLSPLGEDFHARRLTLALVAGRRRRHGAARALEPGAAAGSGAGAARRSDLRPSHHRRRASSTSCRRRWRGSRRRQATRSASWCAMLAEDGRAEARCTASRSATT